MEQLGHLLGDEEGRVVLSSRQRGVTIIELAIGLAILGTLVALALPSFTLFLQNTQIRNAADTTLAGLNLARAEAVRRNVAVRFSLVSDLTSGCALTTSGRNWVVSLANPAGACDAAPSPTTAPQIIQKKAGAEGGSNATVAATGGATVTFNGLGRVTGGGATQIAFGNTQGTCELSGGSMRCLRIEISTGGAIKLCDPKIAIADDPRRCSLP